MADENQTQIYETLLTNIENIKTLQSQLNMQIKTLETEVKTQMKKNGKSSKRKFKIAPVEISNNLREFMKIEDETKKFTRTDITQHIIKYIKENNLLSSAEKHVVIPNDELLQLLNITKNDKITLFNIQSYMNFHFVNE